MSVLMDNNSMIDGLDRKQGMIIGFLMKIRQDCKSRY
jgi:hypothetical protein